MKKTTLYIIGAIAAVFGILLYLDLKAWTVPETEGGLEDEVLNTKRTPHWKAQLADFNNWKDDLGL